MSAQPRRYCTFWLGEECFGVDILAVREIRRCAAVSAVPGAHPAVRGLLNLRGQIATLIDPAVPLGQAPRPLGAGTRLIVLKTNAELVERGAEALETCDDLVALCADAIADVIEIPDEAIDGLPAGAASRGEPLLRGVALVGDACVRILAPQRVLALGSAA